jgi:hypothetical protein
MVGGGGQGQRERAVTCGCGCGRFQKRTLQIVEVVSIQRGVVLNLHILVNLYIY